MSFRQATKTALLVTAFALTPMACVSGVENNTDAKATEFFGNHIRPLLASKCLKCHGPQKQEGNLRLDSLKSMLQGGDSGPAIAIGKPTESLLIEAVNYQSFEMPPSQEATRRRHSESPTMDRERRDLARSRATHSARNRVVYRSRP